MADRADDIQQDIADTQRDIDDTRSAMTEKLELLGERVQETVEGAQASVAGMMETVRDTVDTTVAAVKQTVAGAQASVGGMVENVRGTVGETVDAVQRTFDLHHQMEQHPWLLLGGATVVGYLLGSRGNGRTVAGGSAPEPRFAPATRPAALSYESSAPLQSLRGLGSSLQEQFKDEIAILKSAAVGAVVSTLLAVVKQALPAVASHSKSETTKLNGHLSERPALTQTTIAGTRINGTTIF